MQELNLPKYNLKIKKQDDDLYIFDIFRKRYLKITPEEWVRQNFAHYLINELNYPESLIQTEYSLKINGLTKRADILASNRNGEPLLMVECKAPSIKIDQKTFDQIAVYNMKLDVDILVVSNGLNHYCCKMDYKNSSYIFLKEIPDFNSL